VLCFNDDIQGTAGVALAGVYASTRISKIAFKDLRIMFLGAGSAATGIADLISYAFQKEGFSDEEARRKLWFVNSKGLVVQARNDLHSHNLPYAHDHPEADFISAIKKIRPHVLIGATGFPGTFTQEVVELMSELNSRPAIFALSNPTSRAECTAEQAYSWSQGRAIFTSGSPFGKVEYENKCFTPGQGNNAYIFPGIGLGVVISEASRISEKMFLEAAKTLANLVSEEDLDAGAIYPSLENIRDVSIQIAIAVAEEVYDNEPELNKSARSIRQEIEAYMYQPNY